MFQSLEYNSNTSRPGEFGGLFFHYTMYDDQFGLVEFEILIDDGKGKTATNTLEVGLLNAIIHEYSSRKLNVAANIAKYMQVFPFGTKLFYIKLRRTDAYTPALEEEVRKYLALV
jgi:hypothetical protein